MGVNRYRIEEDVEPELSRVDEAVRDAQVAAVQRVRAERDDAAVRSALEVVAETARGDGNLLPPLREALARMATVGEVCNALRGVFGRYQPS